MQTIIGGRNTPFARISAVSVFCVENLQRIAARKCLTLQSRRAEELVAAIFGYDSHSSLLSDEKSSTDDIGRAEILVPDVERLRRRLVAFGIASEMPSPEAISREICVALKQARLFSGEFGISSSIDEYVMDVLAPREKATVLAFLADELDGFEDYVPGGSLEYDSAEAIHYVCSVEVVLTGAYIFEHANSRRLTGHIPIRFTVDLPRICGLAAYGEAEFFIAD